MRTERGLDRLVNFTDATVAIAMTLLVLPLVDIAPELSHTRSFGALIAGHLGTVIAFVITFVVIARFWMVHHVVFERLQDYSPAIVWINVIWLLDIVSLPFAANLLSVVRGGTDTYTAAVPVFVTYIAIMLVASASILGIEIVMRHRPALLRPEARDDIDLSRATATVAVLVVALVLAAAVPAVGMFWLILLFASGWIAAVLRRYRPWRHAPAVPGSTGRA